MVARILERLTNELRLSWMDSIFITASARDRGREWGKDGGYTRVPILYHENHGTEEGGEGSSNIKERSCLFLFCFFLSTACRLFNDLSSSHADTIPRIKRRNGAGRKDGGSLVGS